MPKHTPFFKFDAMEWLGGSIQTCTLDEKGLFIDICALYWKDYKPVKIDTKFKVRYRNLEGTLSNLIGTLSDLGFIVVSEAEITVPFLDALMDDREKFLEKCSKAGKKSRSVQGTSSNKKEESRKKKEEIREKREEKTTPALEVIKEWYDRIGVAISSNSVSEWQNAINRVQQELSITPPEQADVLRHAMDEERQMPKARFWHDDVIGIKSTMKPEFDALAGIVHVSQLENYNK